MEAEIHVKLVVRLSGIQLIGETYKCVPRRVFEGA